MTRSKAAYRFVGTLVGTLALLRELAAAVGIVLLPAGALIARPAAMGRASAVVFGFSGLLALQESYSADFPGWGTACWPG